MKTYLKISFAGKDEAKKTAAAAGTRILWDADKKSWYWEGDKENLPEPLKQYFTGEQTQPVSAKQNGNGKKSHFVVAVQDGNVTYIPVSDCYPVEGGNGINPEYVLKAVRSNGLERDFGFGQLFIVLVDSPNLRKFYSSRFHSVINFDSVRNRTLFPEKWNEIYAEFETE